MAAFCRGAWGLAGLCLASVVALMGFAQAQTVQPPPAQNSPAPLVAQYNAAFEQMLRQPSNLDAIFNYARLAAQVGDYEGAIGAYERMLIYNPKLPTVRYELGRLYYLLGSYAFADDYFRGALANDIPADVRADIESYRRRIGDLQATDRITGSIGMGFEYQSNANAAPAAVRVFGFNATPGSSFQKQSDGSFYVNGDALYVHDFHTQSGITAEIGFTAYGAQQFHATEFSLGALELTPGLRFPVLNGGSGEPTLSVRPYLIGDFTSLDYQPFYHAVGGGTNFHSVVTPELTVNIDTEYRRRSFTDTTVNPTLDLMDGNLTLTRVSASYLITASDLVEGTLQYTRNGTRAPFDSYNEYLGGISYSHAFADPFKLTGKNWIVSLRGGGAMRPYDQPDPTVDPGSTRFDHEWTAGATLTIGLTDALAAVVQAQQLWELSSIPNYRYRNTIGLLGIRYAF